MIAKVYLLLLSLLLPFTEHLQAQNNLASDYHIGLQVGTVTGLDLQYYATPNLVFNVTTGYLMEKNALSNRISIDFNLPLGAYQRDALYTGLGYSLNSHLGAVEDVGDPHNHAPHGEDELLLGNELTFLALQFKLGYRHAFGDGPFGIGLEWQPWADGFDHVHWMSGGLSFQYGFKASKKSRSWHREALNGYYTRAIGLIVGIHNGISFKNFISPRVAFHLQVYHRSFGESFNFAALASYNQPLGRGLFLVGGLGAGYHLIEARINEPFIIDSQIQGLLGFEYNFFGKPFSIGLQWMPHYSPNPGFEAFEAGFVGRYTF